MIRAPILLWQLMILVHTVDGRPAAINAEQITQMGPPGATQTEKSNCLIRFNGGHFINTLETCDVVGELWRVEDAKEK